ncbi:MAG: hypothetical protein ACE5JI_21200 [Acidobacteriota bacterium]
MAERLKRNLAARPLSRLFIVLLLPLAVVIAAAVAVELILSGESPSVLTSEPRPRAGRIFRLLNFRAFLLTPLSRRFGSPSKRASSHRLVSAALLFGVGILSDGAASTAFMASRFGRSTKPFHASSSLLVPEWVIV